METEKPTEAPARFDVAGRQYPVEAWAALPEIGLIPVLDIPVMSEEQERELAAGKMWTNRKESKP